MSRLFAFVIAVPACSIAWADDSFTVPKNAARVLDQRCSDCHGADTAEGDVRFDTLLKLNKDERLELLNKAQEQIFFGLMPPNDAEQPSEAERELMVQWMSGELKRYGASRLEDKLRKPAYGNYVDHDKLFPGEYKGVKGFTYDRRWLISEFIFDARFNQILNHKPFKTIDGKRQYVIGDNNRRVNLDNPPVFVPG